MDQKQIDEMKNRSNAQLQADLAHAHQVIDHLASMNGRLQAEVFSSNLKMKAKDQQLTEMIMRQEDARGKGNKPAAR